MFKRTKKRIVAAIMASLILFIITALLVVYLSSYYSVSSDNREMLKRHVEMIGGGRDGAPPDGELPPDADALPDGRPPFDDRRRDESVFELSTFYTVIISDDGSVTVDNGNEDVFTDEELTEKAKEIAEIGKKSGKVAGLLYMVEKRDGSTVVAFMDSSVTDRSMSTLLRNILIAGGASIVVVFFISLFIAGRIVKPLEENDRLQRQFVSDAGHELKTPVSVIGTNTELLSRDIGENEWLSNIVYENERMARLVTELLDLSRAESAKPEYAEVDLSRLVTGEALPFESVAFERGKTLTADVKDGTEIKLSLKTDRKDAILSVENGADEIPQDRLEHLFDRFYRGDDARGDEDGHYGLGLAIAKATVEAHRGEIGAEYRDGSIIFTATIPIAK